jgi:hypothetical protein
MSIPRLETYLPELMPFVESLAQDAGHDALADWRIASQKVWGFFTAQRMDQFESISPGWHEMASYGDGITLVHVMLVFTGLVLCPEYQRLGDEQQTILKWSVLFHDVAKALKDGKRDFTHAFRSAAVAGLQLSQLGFPVYENSALSLAAWAKITRSAITTAPESGIPIQDNRCLPEIVTGIDSLFGVDTHAALILKIVLFHMAITVSRDWPQIAPLTDSEMHTFLDDDKLLPLLTIMMLVDGQAWDFFNPQGKTQGRVETLATFERVKHSLYFMRTDHL